MTLKVQLFLARARYKIFSIAVVMVKIFNVAIGKNNKSWYVNNIFDLTLKEFDNINRLKIEFPAESAIFVEIEDKEIFKPQLTRY